MTNLIKQLHIYRSFVIGFLLVLTGSIYLELFEAPVHFFTGIIFLVIGVYFAQKTVRHFHFDHQHTGDSIVDSVPLITLLLANILHPAVDGLSWYETFTGRGLFAGIIFGISIVLHEIFRQTALIDAFKKLQIKGYVVIVTAVLGTGIGIATGFFNTTFFHRYEYIADFATLFAYGFVIGEYFLGHHHNKKDMAKNISLVFGILLGIAFIVFTKSM
jgi:hypothetical protein